MLLLVSHLQVFVGVGFEFVIGYQTCYNLTPYNPSYLNPCTIGLVSNDCLELLGCHSQSPDKETTHTTTTLRIFPPEILGVF